MQLNESLSDLIFSKGELKQNVYNATKESFELFRQTAKDVLALLQEKNRKEGKDIKFEYTDRGDFEFEIRFAGDLLIFMMHTNVFEFSRNHEVMKSPYIRENPSRWSDSTALRI